MKQSMISRTVSRSVALALVLASALAQGCNTPWTKVGWAGKMPAAYYMQESTTVTVDPVYISPTGGTDVYRVRTKP